MSVPLFRSLILLSSASLLSFVVAWITQGRGIIRDIPERNIAIPDSLSFPLDVQVAYNDQDIFFHYRWPAERPHIAMDMLRYTDGEWVRHGASPIGQQSDGLYEDRITMLVDDGRVPEFGLYGGYITVGSGYRFLTGAASAEEVSQHPHFAKLNATDVRKSLPATRLDVADWSSVVDAETLANQRKAGYFLDLWHWRAHRSNPIDMSDDQYIAEFRHSDSGTGSFTTNWDSAQKRPRWMFNAAQTGKNALAWTDIIRLRDDFDSIYYLSETLAAHFDPDQQWQDGDTLPRQLLRQPQGARATIRVDTPARWRDGYWNVTLARALDTGYPLEDKAFHVQGVYDIAFAVHRHAAGSRWHHVSLPKRLGLGREADIQARAFQGEQADWSRIPTHTITLFYPGQITWDALVSQRHAGKQAIDQGIPVRAHHNEKQLALYGVEKEFESDIIRQWALTLIMGLVLIVTFMVAISRLFARGDR